MIPTCTPIKESSSSCSRGRHDLCRLIQQRKQHRARRTTTRIAPSLLGGVKRQVPARNLVVGPVDRTLELRPEAFDCVGVNVAAHVLPAAMVDNVVIVAPVPRVVVNGQFVGVERRILFDVLVEEAKDFRRRHAIDDLHPDASPALYEADYRSLARCATSALAAAPIAAVIRLVAFDGAFEFVRVGVVLHQPTNRMRHAPRRLVGHAELTLEFERRDPVPAAAHQEHREEPKRQRCGRVVEDGSRRWADLGTAPRTGERLTSRDAVEAVTLSAHTDGAVLAVSLLEQVQQTGVVVWELLAEVGKGVFGHGSGEARNLVYRLYMWWSGRNRARLRPPFRHRNVDSGTKAVATTRPPVLVVTCRRDLDLVAGSVVIAR